MVSAGDFRNGITFEMDGNVYSIIEFQHVKPGKGAAFVRTKIRNVITGSVVEKTFNPNDRLYRQKGYAVSVQRRRSVLFHGFGVL
mgnify:CR=1 FL=1